VRGGFVLSGGKSNFGWGARSRLRLYSAARIDTKKEFGFRWGCSGGVGILSGRGVCADNGGGFRL